MRSVLCAILLRALVLLCLCGGPSSGLARPQPHKKARGQARGPALEAARLSNVSPEVRTQTRRGEWLEALPDQQVDLDTRIATGKSGGAEIRVGREIHIQIEPAALLSVKKLPRGGRGVSELEIISGTVIVEVAETAGIGPVVVRTSDGELRLSGTTVRVQSDRPGRTSVAVYKGLAKVRIHGTEFQVAAGQGALLGVTAPGRGKGPPPPLFSLPATPKWVDGPLELQGSDQALLVPALDRLDASAASVELRLDFTAVRGAAGYLVELARDQRFNEHRLSERIPAPPFRIQVPPGLYYARLTAWSSEGILGPASTPRPIYIVPLRSDAAAVGEAAGATLRLTQPAGATLRAIGGGLPLRLSAPGRPAQDCASECLLHLGPGEHRVTLAIKDARAYVQVAVPPPPPLPPPPPPPPVRDRVEPAEIAVPLLAPGFAGRPLDPRTRVYAAFTVASSDANRAVNVFRLDLGGELMLIRRRLSLDLNVPLLYYLDLPAGIGGTRSGPALGDVSFGGRIVAVEALAGQLRLGPLLRLQAPTGTYERGPSPEHPVIIDPALGLAMNFGRLGLLTTQGLPISVNVQPTKLRWSMSYTAELKLWKLALLGQLDAAIGLYGGVPAGAALGGGARLYLGSRGQWRILGGAAGGLAETGQALFGRYSATLGLEWCYR